MYLCQLTFVSSGKDQLDFHSTIIKKGISRIFICFVMNMIFISSSEAKKCIFHE